MNPVEKTFSDYLIKPKYSTILSRKLVNLNTGLGRFGFTLPIISANMKTITGPKMAKTLAKMGALGILHRFNTIEEAIRDYTEAALEQNTSLPVGTNRYNVGVSIGVKDKDRERFDKLYELGARIICIDVAHGHHVLVKDMIRYISRSVGIVSSDQAPCIIAGNIATKEAALDLAEWGASVCKVGIGPGRACWTRLNTGVGVPQIHALADVCFIVEQQKLPLQVIADGGITCIGDIAKALVFADMVMVGSFIAGTSETPGKVFKKENGEYYKVYSGSTSQINKDDNDHIEGTTVTVPLRGNVRYLLKEIEQGLKSACSYVGARDLSEFKIMADLIEISFGAQKESKI